ncbi:MAG: hypothetical protein JSW40_00685 [Candidatus Omnitrophota bacterium]|nr:MAG: hypothetical protein JSW40_00685 [Candidatus Omnitrophota bacterium]
MNSVQNRRRRMFANKLHKQTLSLVFCVALIPTLICTVCLFYLIFGITAMQIGIPEAIAYNVIPAARQVTVIILIALPIAVTVIFFFVRKITHTIVGPFDRIVRELDEIIQGTRKGPIVVRKNDKFLPLVERVNVLLERLSKD